MEKLSDEELKGKTAEFRARLEKGEVLENLIPEAFAVVREASKRVFGMRHFDVQLLGGMVLASGEKTAAIMCICLPCLARGAVAIPRRESIAGRAITSRSSISMFTANRR